MHPRRLRRLAGFSYSGPNRYFLTICARDRRPLFENGALAECVRTQILLAADALGYIVVAYCVMPDHVHVLVEAANDCATLPEFVKRAKQLSGFHGRRIIGAAVWQTGYFERVLREREHTHTVVAYILNNPVRRGLVEDPRDYPFSGSGVCGMSELVDLVQIGPAPGSG